MRAGWAAVLKLYAQLARQTLCVAAFALSAVVWTGLVVRESWQVLTMPWIEAAMARADAVVPHALATLSVFLAAGFATVVLCSNVRKTRCFVSYQHGHAALAQAVAAALETHNVSADIIAFEPRAHDETVFVVQNAIRRCDVVLAIPGANKSWMDHEITAASALRKGIVILDHLSDQREFDTTYLGYPVFSNERLNADGYEPLARFLKLVEGHWSVAAVDFGRAVGFAFVVSVGLFLALVAMLLLGGTSSITLISLLAWPIWGVEGMQRVQLFAQLAGANILLAPLAVGVALQVTWAVLARRHAAAVISQRVRTGRLTASELKRRAGHTAGLAPPVLDALVSHEAAVPATVPASSPSALPSPGPSPSDLPSSSPGPLPSPPAEAAADGDRSDQRAPN